MSEWQRYKNVRLNKPGNSLPEHDAFGSMLQYEMDCHNNWLMRKWHTLSSGFASSRRIFKLPIQPACYGTYLSFSFMPMLTSSASWRILNHLWYLQAYAEIPLIVTTKEITKSQSQSGRGNALMMAYRTHRSHLLRLFAPAFSKLVLDDRCRRVLDLIGGGYGGSVGPAGVGVSAIPLPPSVVPSRPTGSMISSSLSLMFTHSSPDLIVALSPIVVATGTERVPSGTACSHAASIGEKYTPACCAAARSSNTIR